MASPEARTLLDELYYQTYLGPPKTKEEDMFSSIIYRNEDSLDEFISLESMLKEYIGYDFAKNYNMSIDEFLSLTFFEKNYLVRAAQFKEKQMKKQLAEYERRKSENDAGKIDISQFSQMDDLT